jgi:hypothetical protein
MREERQGFILGPYEKGAPAWAVDGVSESFGQELLAPDIDRLEPHINAAINRVPAFGKVGVKDCINGPIPYTPDGSPLIGPAWGLKNFWLAEGFSFGITAAGGAGDLLTDWMVEGEPTIDPWEWTPALRPYANKRYTKIKNEVLRRLHPSLSAGRAARRAAGQDRALLRPHEGAGRRPARNTAGSGRTGSRLKEQEGQSRFAAPTSNRC